MADAFGFTNEIRFGGPDLRTAYIGSLKQIRAAMIELARAAKVELADAKTLEMHALDEARSN